MWNAKHWACQLDTKIVFLLLRWVCSLQTLVRSLHLLLRSNWNIPDILLWVAPKCLFLKKWQNQLMCGAMLKSAISRASSYRRSSSSSNSSSCCCCIVAATAQHDLHDRPTKQMNWKIEELRWFFVTHDVSWLPSIFSFVTPLTCLRSCKKRVLQQRQHRLSAARCWLDLL